MIDNTTIEKLYSLVEEARLLLWREIAVSEEPIRIGDGKLPYTVEKTENGYKITIKDILPRNKELVRQSSLQTAWYAALTRAFAQVNQKYERLLVVIIPYLPTRNAWDVDNRPYKMIINACKYAKLVPDDDWNHLAFMVIGQFDENNPRTEIHLMELPISGEIKLPYLAF